MKLSIAKIVQTLNAPALDHPLKMVGLGTGIITGATNLSQGGFSMQGTADGLFISHIAGFSAGLGGLLFTGAAIAGITAKYAYNEIKKSNALNNGIIATLKSAYDVQMKKSNAVKHIGKLPYIAGGFLGLCYGAFKAASKLDSFHDVSDKIATIVKAPLTTLPPALNPFLSYQDNESYIVIKPASVSFEKQAKTPALQ